MPTKQDIIAWIVTILICALLFALGCVRQSSNNDFGNIINNGDSMLCDTITFHNNTIGK